MTIETVKGRYTTITYSRDTYHIIHSEIELGDCLFAKFDEQATYITYKSFQIWALEEKKSKVSKEEPGHITPYALDLAPATVFVTHQRVKEIYEDFNEIITNISGTVYWPKDLPIQ